MMRVENKIMMLRFIFFDTYFIVSAASSSHYELQSRRSAHRNKGKARVPKPGPFSTRSTGEVSPARYFLLYSGCPDTVGPPLRSAFSFTKVWVRRKRLSAVLPVPGMYISKVEE